MRTEIVENMNKGDFMRACTNMDNRIKELDSAIPMQLGKAIRDLGIDSSMFVMCYWKNGEIECLNICEHWAKLYTREG